MRRVKIRWMLLPIMLWILSSCSTLPPRPNSYICVVNARGAHAKCFHMQRDYDEVGNLLESAVPFYMDITKIEDIDKFIIFDAESFGNLKAYVNQLKQK